MRTEAARIVEQRLRQRKWSQGRLRRAMIERGEPVASGLICRWLSGDRDPSNARAVLIDEILGGVDPKLWTVPAKGRAA